jgi:antitoxin ParD1/3/4
MATMNISLPDKMRDWVESQIEAGQYSNNSDYVRDLIRKDQQRNDKLIALQNTVFNKDAFKSRMIENKKDG